MIKKLVVLFMVILIVLMASGPLTGCKEQPTPTAPVPTPTPSPQPAPAPAPDVPQQKVKDIEPVMSEAEKIGIHVRNIFHEGNILTIDCQADSYNAFRDYLIALEESGRFSTPIPRPKGYPYTLDATIKLEPKFQYIDMSTVYYEVDQAPSRLPIPNLLSTLVSIAEASGIDVSLDAGKLKIPPPSLPREVKTGQGSYQFFSFKDIRVQGDYENVIAFISNLDSGKTLKTAILARVSISQLEVNSKIETIAIVDVDIYER